MSGHEAGGPAFPMQGMTDRNGQKLVWVYSEGMTLRDYFAAKAMASAIRVSMLGEWTIEHKGRTASEAYALVDAMMEARK